MNKFICIAYISFFSGVAAKMVGTMPEIPTEPFSALLPLSVFLLLGAPALLGYLAGKYGE